MTLEITAAKLINLHQNRLNDWQNNAIISQHQAFLKLVEENHAFNYQLWQAEDRARRDDLGPEFVYQAKREIDQCNQQRNNRMEAMDTWLFEALQPAPPESCPVHSESPGMIIDRLSILALKIFHMQIQTVRPEVDATHRENCRQKLATLHTQHRQLGQCLDELLEGVQNKSRTFRIYHQFKMYNDPMLNPQLYAISNNKDTV